jgi:TIR domain
MPSQEDLYQLIYYKQWKESLDILYRARENIKSDSLLNKAARTFETEFFSNLSNVDNLSIEVVESLELLYVLHHSKFFALSDANYKTLNIEIVKRKEVKQAYGYAKNFPNEEICKRVIAQYEVLKQKEEGYNPAELLILPDNWTEIFNRLFELINNKDDDTYFSGPRFIKVVKQYESYFPDYPQYIQSRELEGKSTTRKIYFYDILLGLPLPSRDKVISRIMDIVLPTYPEKVAQIQHILSGVKMFVEEKPAFLRVFISYSWDDEVHKEWVLKLANRLCTDGIDVILDRFSLNPGANLPHFVEQSISKSDRIVIIFTENYKLKADNRSGGVGYEYSIVNAELYNKQTSNDKIIPILRKGSMEASIPAFMQQLIHIDSRNDEMFENSYNDLLREIYNEPKIKKPKIGEKPTFDI